ncbi:helix-turn-helix domain-containing protein [Limibacter armeniacum]|uniref:helix-turn-helix domain-containing protein n=1 Tax=Limibacter armeniacum TaxID=466084 RepID=UPI002FE5D552
MHQESEHTNRTFRHLTKAQRMMISVFLYMGKSQAVIARLIGVHRSTISREIKRNSHGGVYDPFKADSLYQGRLFVRGSARKSGLILPELFPRKAAPLPYGRVCTAWNADYNDCYLRGPHSRRSIFILKSPSLFKLHEKPIQPRLNRPHVQLLLLYWKALSPRLRDFESHKTNLVIQTELLSHLEQRRSA